MLSGLLRKITDIAQNAAIAAIATHYFVQFSQDSYQIPVVSYPFNTVYGRGVIAFLWQKWRGHLFCWGNRPVSQNAVLGGFVPGLGNVVWLWTLYLAEQHIQL